MAYKGESAGKKLSRAKLYMGASEWFIRTGAKKQSDAIILCGYEAAEVAALRRFVDWTGKIVAADLDPTGLDAAKRHGATPFLGDVSVAIARSSRIGFAHLDWTGPIGTNEMRAIIDVANKMPYGGVLATTFLAARDRGNQFSIVTKNRKCTCGACDEDVANISSRDPRGGAGRALIDEFLPLGYKSWQLLFTERYNSGRSPMQTICVVKMPGSIGYDRTGSAMFIHSTQLNKARDAALDCQESGCACCISERVRYQPESHHRLLRESVLRKVDNGLSDLRVASLYNLRPGTIAAWKAHRTMGTYGDAGAA